jgi:hypothetical protein
LRSCRGRQAVKFLQRICQGWITGQDQPCQDTTLRRVVLDLIWFTHDFGGVPP